MFTVLLHSHATSPVLGGLGSECSLSTPCDPGLPLPLEEGQTDLGPFEVCAPSGSELSSFVVKNFEEYGTDYRTLKIPQTAERRN